MPISRVAEGLVPWRAGTLEFLEGWYPGGLVPWRAGTLEFLEGWYPGGLVPWSS